MSKQIPTHDPYTGEINPYYEELTGQANPLVEKHQQQLYEEYYTEEYFKNYIPVRFPNESTYQKIPFKWNEFKVENIFDDTVFGWYGEIYINVKRRDYDKYARKTT